MRFLLITLLIIHFSLLTISCSFTSEPAPEVKEYLREVISIIQKNSLYADSLDWDDINNKIAILSKGLKKPEECKPVMDFIVQSLRRAGDKHSFFLNKQLGQKIKVESLGGKEVDGAYLGKGIGYIKVSSFASFSAAETSTYASLIKNHIKTIDTLYDITAWIVDLRGNDGGNMYPMIAGLNCLTKDGLYGYFLSPMKDKNETLFANNGVAGMASVDQPYKIKNLSCKIAVLINSMTLSSGEMTALSFKGLPNVRFFGQTTGAFTTSNQSYELSDGSYLLLATSYMADRNRKTYLDGIVPDVITPIEKDSIQGQTIEIAKTWLMSK